MYLSFNNTINFSRFILGFIVGTLGIFRFGFALKKCLV